MYSQKVITGFNIRTERQSDNEEGRARDSGATAAFFGGSGSQVVISICNRSKHSYCI